MKKGTLAVRVLMGLIFLGAGASFFFMPPPPPMEGPMGDFFKGMVATQYFFYLLKSTEVVCGLLLISGMFVPLALVVLAPVILNIFLVHAFMMPQGILFAVVLGAFEIYLAFFSREYSPTIKQLFKMKST